jgi:DNA-binding response OmpR family regulator
VPTPPGRVLVVDDNDAIRHLISVNLELEGFEVVTACDGHECLDLVHVFRPDLVTLDVVLPRLDGVRTTERLRADPRTSHLKIAMITAAAQDQDKERGWQAGVDAYLIKPFDPEHLVRTVKGLLEVDVPGTANG